MKRQLVIFTTVTLLGAALAGVSPLVRDIDIPWSAVFPVALLVAYCAGSLVFGRRAA